MLSPSVFKAYDVRGLYPSELDEDGAYSVGRAYAEHFEPRTIAVGRDMRLSSPSMAAATIEGAADGGADVLDVGLVGTEMVFGAVGRRGEVREEDVWPGFVEKVLSFVDLAAIRPLRVVVDAANGMAGVMLPPVLDRLPQLEVVRCYFDPDGTFPNHEPNPLLPENREFVVEKTRSERADLGVAYDGDADRCFFV